MINIEKYIKSPLNYVGSKYKLLNQILPRLPSNINTFVDLFGGGFNVGVNVAANKVIYNDSLEQIADLIHYFKTTNIDTIINEIEYLINEYGLSKSNKEGYLRLRDSYNLNKADIKLYTLICHSFSNQIRFNSNGAFNIPFGERYFNESIKTNLKKFVERLHIINIEITKLDFREFNNKWLSNNDLVYADPPYYNSTATYNENGGWTEKDEKCLHNILDKLNDNGVKFGLSNNLKYENPLLDKWKNKYNVHYLSANYNNCNYQKKDKSNDVEVLITNY